MERSNYDRVPCSRTQVSWLTRPGFKSTLCMYKSFMYKSLELPKPVGRLFPSQVLLMFMWSSWNLLLCISAVWHVWLYQVGMGCMHALSMYFIQFTVTPCVLCYEDLFLRTCLVIYSTTWLLRNRFSGFGKLLSSEKSCPAY